jgi:hypothetical protein
VLILSAEHGPPKLRSYFACWISYFLILSSLFPSLTHLVEVIDELCQVLNGVDVVVGGWGDEGHTGLGAAQLGDVWGHLGPRQLATLTCASKKELGDTDRVSRVRESDEEQGRVALGRLLW